MTDKTDPNLGDLFARLGHPLRIQILEMLGDEGSIGFTQLKNDLSLSVGSLYYHLEVLGDFITQNEQRKYILTPRGEIALELLESNREQLYSAPAMTLAGKSRRSSITRELLFGRRIFAAIALNPLRYIPEAILIIAFGGWIFSLVRIEPLLLYYNTVPTWNDPVLIFIEFVLSWFILSGLCVGFSYIICRRRGGEASLFVSSAFALLPIIAIPTLLVANSLWSLGLIIDSFWITAALLICQAWTLCLLTAAIGYAKGLLFEKAALVSLFIVYVNIAFLFLFVFIL